MKRVVTFLLAVCFLMSCAGCAGASGSDDAYTLEAYPSGSAYLNVPAVYETAVTAPTQAEPVTAQMAFTNGENGIDIDLTVLSSTMIYSFVYCMITSPDEYTGMVVKMCGIATSYHNEDTDVWYHACIIQDATACCSQGIEFELVDAEDPVNDYPADGEIIFVQGTFGTYEENGNTYCILYDAELV